MYHQNNRSTALGHYLRTGQKIGGFEPNGYKSYDLCNMCGGTVSDLDIKGIRSERDARYRDLLARHEAAKRAGKTHKIWQIGGGITTRPSHRQANGQKVRIDKNFQVGDGQMFLPNDPGASLAETANCRCVVRYVQEGRPVGETFVRPGVQRKDRLAFSRTHREAPVDIFLPENHGYSVISVHMTSLGDSLFASKIPLTNIKIPRAGGNGITIELRGFGSKYDKIRNYPLDRGKPETKYFAIHPRRRGVILIKGITSSPIDVDVYGYTYFPTYNLE